jgi:hypothetical protein
LPAQNVCGGGGTGAQRAEGAGVTREALTLRVLLPLARFQQPAHAVLVRDDGRLLRRHLHPRW